MKELAAESTHSRPLGHPVCVLLFHFYFARRAAPPHLCVRSSLFRLTPNGVHRHNVPLSTPVVCTQDPVKAVDETGLSFCTDALHGIGLVGKIGT